MFHVIEMPEYPTVDTARVILAVPRMLTELGAMDGLAMLATVPLVVQPL